MFSRGFVSILSIKVLLVMAMAGLQVWMGIAWKPQGGPVDVAARKARTGLALLLLIAAAAVLLGLGVRSI